jgi:hypothetical protein
LSSARFAFARRLGYLDAAPNHLATPSLVVLRNWSEMSSSWLRLVDVTHFAVGGFRRQKLNGKSFISAVWRPFGGGSVAGRGTVVSRGKVRVFEEGNLIEFDSSAGGSGGIFELTFDEMEIEFVFVFVYSFGKRSGISIRRPNECLILEPSEMLVVSRPFDFFFVRNSADWKFGSICMRRTARFVWMNETFWWVRRRTCCPSQLCFNFETVVPEWNWKCPAAAAATPAAAAEFFGGGSKSARRCTSAAARVPAES